MLNVIHFVISLAFRPMHCLSSDFFTVMYQRKFIDDEYTFYRYFICVLSLQYLLKFLYVLFSTMNKDWRLLKFNSLSTFSNAVNVYVS